MTIVSTPVFHQTILSNLVACHLGTMSGNDLPEIAAMIVPGFVSWSKLPFPLPFDKILERFIF
jgi:tetrahydromethanopterin S-methyltransferase subunit E